MSGTISTRNTLRDQAQGDATSWQPSQETMPQPDQNSTQAISLLSSIYWSRIENGYSGILFHGETSSYLNALKTLGVELGDETKVERFQDKYDVIVTRGADATKLESYNVDLSDGS